jgi:putative heme-binding domain-containing protein
MPMRAAAILPLLFAANLLLAAGPYDQHIAKSEPRTPAEERKCFHLPPGFDVELVAAEPQIHKPLNIAFDERGRLWVSDTLEYPFPAPAGKKGRDTIKILEDFDAHGRARQVTTFADGLNIPIGLMPIHGGAIGYSIPNIYRYLDSDGDGKSDQRSVLYGSIGYRDTHGMTSAFTWGFDGWMYACHGYANESTVKGADGSSVRMQSGNTYRMRPDGSHVEQFTHGQVNPFGLCFDPLGNLYSADCHTKPVMMLLRGGWYESFGKPHDGLGFAPEMLDRYDDSTAIAGISYYAADQFPPDYRGSLFIGDVVTNNVVQFRLEWHGSTPRARLRYFLKSDDPWFRPVDIKLGPDGALYVADFYNRIIGHYEVPLTHPGRDRERGRIWRIVYRGPDGQRRPVQPRPDWSKAPATELVDDLAHPNLTVRMMATNQLVERGGAAGAAAVRGVFQSQSSPFQRAHGLWVLQRLGALDEATLAAAAKDAAPLVRVHALHVLSERTDLPELLLHLAWTGLRDSDAFAQRAAADALGRHPAPENMRPLLDLRHAVPAEDAQLLHTVRMALRDQLRAASSWAALPTKPWSDADARAIADVCPGVPSAEAATYLLRHIRNLTEPPDVLARYVHHIARHQQLEAEPELLAFVRGCEPESLRQQAQLLRAVQQGTQERGGRLSTAAQHWGEELVAKLLAARDGNLVLAGIEQAGALKVAAVQEQLVALARGKDRPEPQRRAAVAALLASDGSRQIPLLAQLLNDAAEPMPLREQAAAWLAGLNRPEARAELLKGLPIAPSRLQGRIAAELTRGVQGAEQLLQAVAAGKASARLLQERVVILHLEGAHVPQLKERLAKLTQGLPPADQRMQELLRQRRAGFAAAMTDPAAGAKVFEKSCANCHQLGGKGAKIGPQLDGIGVRGVERLLEDILDPNRNVDQAFRATTLLLKSGQIVSGLVLREEGEIVVVADAQGKEVRVPKATIDERTVSQLSPMPANVLEQISEADFYHLLAYLLAQRPAK